MTVSILLSAFLLASVICWAAYLLNRERKIREEHKEPEEDQ